MGLLFTTYEFVLKAIKASISGQVSRCSVLSALLNYHDNLNFVSYFTVKPEKDDVADYLKEFHDIILRSKQNELWILGRMLEHIDKSKLPKQIKAFSNIESLVKQL